MLFSSNLVLGESNLFLVCRWSGQDCFHFRHCTVLSGVRGVRRSSLPARLQGHTTSRHYDTLRNINTVGPLLRSYSPHLLPSPPFVSTSSNCRNAVCLPRSTLTIRSVGWPEYPIQNHTTGNIRRKQHWNSIISWVHGIPESGSSHKSKLVFNPSRDERWILWVSHHCEHLCGGTSRHPVEAGHIVWDVELGYWAAPHGADFWEFVVDGLCEEGANVPIL